MRHLDDGTLHALLDGELDAEAAQAARRHLEACAACARRLDDERAMLLESDQLVAAVDLEPRETESALRPMAPRPVAPRRRFPLRAAAWAATVVLAGGLTYWGAWRGRSGAPASELPAPAAAPAPMAAPAAPGAPDSAAEMDAIQPGGAAFRPPVEAGRAYRAADAEQSRAKEKQVPRDEAEAVPAERQPASRQEEPALPAEAPTAEAEKLVGRARDTTAAANALRLQGVVVTASASAFRAIDLDSAVRLLGGAVRLVEGLEPAQVAWAPGDSVAGAEAGKPLVRVTYALGERRLVLDQQRVAMGYGALVREERPARRMAPAAPAISARADLAADRAAPLAWTQDGFALRLSGDFPRDSLAALKQRVR